MKYIILIIIICGANGFSQENLSADYYNEAHRPQYHFTPQSNWMNDPNGLVYYAGIYHLFYQHNPHDNVWGPMHWGHAISRDLFHWEHQPIALYPDSLGTIFSGSAVIDRDNTAGFGENAMIAIFTYHNDSLWAKGYRNIESQGIAYSLDDGLSWKKYKNNPVIANSSVRDFRDPKVFWNDHIKEWNMVLAAGDRIKIFSSINLKDWKFKSDFKPASEQQNPGVWECPDLFKMKTGTGEKWIMIINHGDKTPNGGSGTRYFIGDFDGEVFKEVQAPIWLDYGMDFYAAVTFSNVPANRKIMISWMSNWKYANKTPTNVWRSAMTLAREFTLDKDDSGYFLRQKIAGDFGSIKNEIISKNEVIIPYALEDLNLTRTEIVFDFTGTNLEIVFSNTLNENIQIELKDDQLSFDRRQSGKTDFNENFAGEIQIMPVEEKISHFQIILDKSSIELLLNNGKYSMTNLFFPNEDFSGLLFESNDHVKIKNLVISEIKRTW